MIFATPFVPGLTDFDKYAADMTKKGMLLSHVHVVISEFDDEPEAFAFGTSVSDLFLKTKFLVLPKLEAKRNRFELANELFRAAVKFHAAYKNDKSEATDPPMLYSDPTYRPQKNQWLNLLQSEFYQNRMPIVTGASTVNEENCKIFQGPIILSKEFVKTTALLDFIPSNAHWRTHLRWELHKGSQDTNLIGAGSESVLKALTVKK